MKQGIPLIVESKKNILNVLIIFLLCDQNYVGNASSEAEFNAVFAESVVSSIETLIAEPRSRVLNVVKGAFSSGENYIIGSNGNVHFNATQSLYWNIKSAFQGADTIDWLMAGFSDGKFIAYAQSLSTSQSDGTLLAQESSDHLLLYYENSTHPITGKINGPQSSNQTYDCTQRPWYLKALEYGNSWSDPYAFIDDGALGLTAVVPMVTASGQLLGIAGVDYRLVVLDEYLNSLVVDSVFTIFIVESSGLMIASSVSGAAVSGVNQVRANSSNVQVIQSVALKVQSEFGDNWTRADGVVMTVDAGTEGLYFAQSQELSDGFGIVWHIVVAETVSCDTGFYISAKSGSRLSNDASVCDPCERGAECVGGGYLPYPKRGYWMDREAKTAKGSIYSCTWNTCIGYQKKTKLEYDDDGAFDNLLDLCWTAASGGSLNKTKCNSDELMCSEGSTGPMCGSCQEKWRYDQTTGQCEKCNEIFWIKALSILSVIVIVIGLTRLSIHGYVICPSRIHRLFIFFTTRIDRGILKVLWSTYQIVQSISFSIQITFPYPYSAFLEWLTFLELDFLNIECLNGDYLERVIIASFFPFALALGCWLLFLLRMFHNKSSFTLNDMKTKHLWHQHCYISLLIIYVVVPPVTNRQFKVLACQNLSDNKSYLRVDTSVDCTSDYYKRFILLDVLMIAAYQFLSLLYIGLLCRVRHRLNPIAPTKALALHIRDNDESLQPLKFLIADYKINFWYFEITDLYRRIIFISVLPIVSQRSLTKAYLGCVLSLFSTIYFREAMPYREHFTNLIAIVAQYIILLDFLGALLVSGLSSIGRSTMNVSFGIVLVCLNLIIIIIAIYLSLEQYKHSQFEILKDKQKALKIEWAAEFSSNKFRTTLDYVLERNVPSSHYLCYYYTSLAQAQESVKLNMIPATLEEDGIMVSLKGPMDIKEGDPSLKCMGERAQSYEAVLCLSLPKQALFRITNRPGLKKKHEVKIYSQRSFICYGHFHSTKSFSIHTYFT